MLSRAIRVRMSTAELKRNQARRHEAPCGKVGEAHIFPFDFLRENRDRIHLAWVTMATAPEAITMAKRRWMAESVSEGLSGAPETNLSPDGCSTAARSLPVSFPSRITCAAYAFHKAEGSQHSDFFLFQQRSAATWGSGRVEPGGLAASKHRFIPLS
ncbi:hypothetical protein AOLI_G00201100 [Acnodon oligacanthus]